MTEMLAKVGWVDGGLLVALLLGILLGAKRGLSHELAILAGFALAVLATRLGYVPLADWMAERVSWSLPVLRFLAVLALMVASLAAMGLVRLALGALMSFAFKGWIERLGGALAGGLRYGLIYLVAMMALSFLPVRNVEIAIRDSYTGERILPLLFDTYNAWADREGIVPASRPVGIELPQVVMPPDDGENVENGGDGGFPAIDWSEGW